MGCFASKERLGQPQLDRRVSHGGDGPTPEVVYRFNSCGPTVLGGRAAPSGSAADGIYIISLGDEVYLYNDTPDRDAHVELEVRPRDAAGQAALRSMSGDDRVLGTKGVWRRVTVTVSPTATLTVGPFGRGRFRVIGQRLTANAEFDEALAANEAAILSELHGSTSNRARRNSAFLRTTTPCHQRSSSVTCCRRDLDAMLEHCVENNALFVDPEFPPTTTSLRRSCDGVKLPVSLYKRPRTYVSGGKAPQLLGREGVTALDMQQGAIGNCYFVAAVASVANASEGQPIEALFRHTGEATAAERAVGAYRVTLNVDGWWTETIIDDYVPCHSQGGPCFGRNKVEWHVWAGLLEKAFCKLLAGSYAAATAVAGSRGHTADAFLALTGCPSLHIDSADDSEELFAKIPEYWASGAVVRLGSSYGSALSVTHHDGGPSSPLCPTTTTTTTTIEQPSHGKAVSRQTGLARGHNYSVLNVVVVSDDTATCRLVQLRNPWGNEVWTGRWGPGSSEWQQHPKVATQLGATEEAGGQADGVFWMQWEDVVTHFDRATVCFLRPPSWHDHRVQGKFELGVPNVVLEVSVTDSVEALLTMSQPTDDDGIRLTVFEHVDEEHHRMYRPLTQSTGNPAHPGLETMFEPRRTIGLPCSFQATTEPYLVVPQTMQKSKSVPFVLGVLSKETSSMRVRFRRLEPQCDLFSGFGTFPPAQVMRDDVSRARQVRKGLLPDDDDERTRHHDRPVPHGVEENDGTGFF